MYIHTNGLLNWTFDKIIALYENKNSVWKHEIVVA